MTKQFTVEGITLTVLRNHRVRPVTGFIADAFEIELPVGFNFYPNESNKATNKLVIYWGGRESVPISGGGTQRGADFRNDFWSAVMWRIGKAQVAARLGKTIKNVTSADLAAATAAEKRLLVLALASEPVNLRSVAIDTAIVQVSDLPPIEEPVLPKGTVANIDADYDAESSTTVKIDNGITISLTGTTSNLRPAWRFPLSVIPTGSTINDVSLRVNITSENIETTDQVNVNAYNSTGDDDPSVDAAATFHTRCGGTTLVSITTPWQTTGLKTAEDLGTTADSQVQGNISSPGRYSIGMTQTNFAATESISFESIEDAGTTPVRLIVDYTEPLVITPTVSIVINQAVQRANVR